jgi:hypothetical protein
VVKDKRLLFTLSPSHALTLFPDVVSLSLAALGGVAGYLLFFLLAAQGLYGIALPGGFVGIGAGIIKPRSMRVALWSAALAIVAGLLTQYRFSPTAAAIGFWPFLLNLQPVTLVMIAVGGFAGFWVPFRRRAAAALVVTNVKTVM